MNYKLATNAFRNRRPIALLLLLIVFSLISSCTKVVESNTRENAVVEFDTGEEIEQKTPKAPHSYGGWYCPDNLRGFPAVDIKDLHKVPVVKDRLPTWEETRNGTSLMFFDTTEISDARPLKMDLPRLARYYNEHSKKDELIIVIQAVVAGQDSVVGFRYLNGGNGSAWLNEVTFVSDTEKEQLGSTPFVVFDTNIRASASKIWEIITDSTKTRVPGALLGENTTIKSRWTAGSEIEYRDASGKVLATGEITAAWPNLYVQIDYNFDGYHYAEKFLLIEDSQSKSTTFHLVSGPHEHNYEDRKAAWHSWIQDIKWKSEWF